MTPPAFNITARGARRRRLGGYLWLVVAIAALAIMIAAGTARSYRLALAVPFLLSAIGFFQARAKTCVALAAVGKQEVEGGGTCPIAAHDRAAIRRQTAAVFARSLIAAAAATAIAWFI